MDGDIPNPFSRKGKVFRMRGDPKGMRVISKRKGELNLVIDDSPVGLISDEIDGFPQFSTFSLLQSP